MTPISTAQLNPEGMIVCVSPDSPVVIPVLLNNTSPSSLRYSLTPLSGAEEPVFFELSSRDLRQTNRAVARPTSSAVVQDEYDDEDDADELKDLPALQKTQSIAHLQISKPGILRLDRVVHSSSVASRLVGRTAMTIAPCPGAAFVDQSESSIPTRCARERKDLDMKIQIHGVPPLALRWSKNAPHGKVEAFEVENIGHGSAPDSLVIPLSVFANSPGVHEYVLESVSDGLGNFVKLGPPPSEQGRRHSSSAANTKTTRAVEVLHTPRVSFVSSRCSSSNPARLLIGSDIQLPIHASDVDAKDGPLLVKVVYEPAPGVDASYARTWPRELYLGGSQHTSQLSAKHPGQYHLVFAEGTFCQAEILNPDVCEIVEIPKPSAKIEWKAIHEWCVLSGHRVDRAAHAHHQLW
jgi:nucleoporin POM152